MYEMITETEKMNSDLNGTNVKTENMDIKEEVKEEPKNQPASVNEPNNHPNNHSGPPSNKLTNGETDNNNQLQDNHTKKTSDLTAVKEETNGEATASEAHSKPLPPTKGQSQQSVPPKTSQPPTNPQMPQQQPPASQPVNSNVPPMPPQSQHSGQPVGMGDNPFIQHQSQIFVFSTQLANEGADHVISGQYKDLLSFHMDYPATKKFLQKHSLKISPFNRSGVMPGMGPRHRDMTPIRRYGNVMRPGPPHPTGSVQQWVDQQNAHLQEQGYNFVPGMNPRAGNFPPSGNPGNPGMMGPWPQGGGPPQSSSPMNYPVMPDGMPFDPEMMAMMGNPHLNNPNLLQQKVPNENLTPEQLKRREEHLTSLRKIQMMLFPEQQRQQQFGGPMPNSGPGGEMMPEEMHQQMMQQQQGMMSSPHGPMMTSQEQMMMGSQNNGGMTSSQQQFMMSQGGPGQFGGQGPGPGSGPGGSGPGSGPGGPGPPGHPGFGPHNMQNMTPAQREWLRLQQEYYMEKRRHQQQQIAQRMGGQPPNMEMPGASPGAPPSYYSTMAQKRGGSGGMSTSPNTNGPIGSPPLMPPHGMDMPDHMGLFPPSAAQRRSSLSSMEQQSQMGMMSPIMSPSMPPGPGMNFDKAMMPHGPGGPGGPAGVEGGSGAPPHMHPGQPGGGPIQNKKSMQGGPRAGHPEQFMQRAGNPEHFVQRAGHPEQFMQRAGNPEQFVQRAGNPEQFHPEIAARSPSRTLSGSSKPPPSYAQAQKRKRDDMEELYKNLQPTPSPQQINYLNQFEGQELTITKHLNAAYREPNNPSDQSHPNAPFPSNQVAHSPMHGPSSNKGPMSNSSQNSSGGPLSSPGPVNGPGPSPNMSGANMRLSHFDPPSNNNSVSSAPATPTSKASSMSNITSASLANLAKGVEHLSNQMQQNMMQGGPFHSIQMQGQQVGCSASSQSTSNQPSVSTTSEMSSQTQTTPSVNNTYVNATMSIQQLNIQSVGPHSGPNYNPNMQVQQMNMEQQQMQGMPGPPNGPGPNSSGMSNSMPSGNPGGMPTGNPAGMPTGNPGGIPTGNPSGMPSGNPGGMPSGNHPGMPSGNHGSMPSGNPGNMPGGNPGNIPGGPQGPGMASAASVSMSQTQSMMTGNSSHSGMGKAPQPFSGGPPSSQMSGGPASVHSGPISGPGAPPHGGTSGRPHRAGSGGPAPGASMMQQQQPSQQQSHPGARPTSPSFANAPCSMGNANVQIQAKAPNTIQYLPAHPPSTQQSMQSQKRPDLEFMQRFAAPMSNMDNKVPTSKMQYFPQPPGISGERHSHSPFGNHGGPMGPGGMPQGMMPMRGGSRGEFPPNMSGGQMGPMSGMGSPDPMGGPMNNSMGPMGNSNVLPGNMPSEPQMMPGGMGMSGEGMMPMDGMPHSMGMPHPNSPPFMESRESMMSNSMMQGPSHMSQRGHGPMMGMGPGAGEMMPGGPGSRMPEMGNYGPNMPRQPNPGGMRMPGGPGNPNMPSHHGLGPGPGMSGGMDPRTGPCNPAYSAQYQQFQQQLYSQGRPRQMSPMGGMMPGGPGQQYMNM
ncbi:trithorax group protein osa-like [Ylistrum balloti]|uniref:trithorax group protein osa-like n=1 Tax=Ylistrum balloti TaxID=509963 RepID=UPI002905C4EA|nr:trithorax group protein osa-like [Ylistrum balloti]